MKQISENSFLLADGEIVHRTNIIGTKHWVYSAWKPMPTMSGEGPAFCSNVTSGLDWSFSDTSGHVRWYGRIGAELLPAELESLKGMERYEKVHAYQVVRWNNAYRIILSVFPEAANGKQDMGEISLTR